MNLPYTYTVDAAVLERFSLSTRKQRETLLRIFDQLAENPFLEGDKSSTIPPAGRSKSGDLGLGS